MSNLTVTDALNLVARTLTLPERAALASGAKAKNSDIAPGVYPVDVTIRVRGTVKKGDDYVAEVPQAVNPWRVLGYVLSKLNATTAESVAKMVADAYASGELEHDLAFKGYAEAAMAKISAATRTVKSGPTTANVTIEIV
jgi:hypothetical protein